MIFARLSTPQRVLGDLPMVRRMKIAASAALLAGLAAFSQPMLGQSSVPVAQEFERLHFRSIGPATMSGRIADVAVYEANPAIYYVGSAHGGVWKTVNNGAKYEPQFQDNGLMAIGDIAV